MTLYMRDMENQKIGREIGEKIGRLAEKISLIRRKKNSYDKDTLSDLYEISKPECQTIISYINHYSNLNDKEIAQKLLNDEDNKK